MNRIYILVITIFLILISPKVYAEESSGEKCQPINCFGNECDLDVSRTGIRIRAPIVYKIARAQGASRRVASMITMVAIRESAATPSIRHRMTEDLIANHKSWRRFYHLYKGSNEHIDDKARWSMGLGLFGANVALNLKVWSKSAPPEVICDPWVAIAIYMRNLRRARKAYLGTLPYKGRRVFCDGERYHGGEWTNKSTPTLFDLHSFVSGGRACPYDGPRKRSFFNRMRSRGINPLYAPKRGELGPELSNSEIMVLKKMHNELAENLL